MQNKRIEIVSLTMARSGTYGSQYRRPFTTNGQGHVINQFQERYDQVGAEGFKASDQLFAGISGEFMRPQAAPESQILIPNDWNTERYYYTMEVIVHNQLSGSTREVIQGYTSYTDPSHGGHFDPNMQFFINSITTLRNTRMNQHGHWANVPQVVDSYHILANNAYSGPGSLLGDNPHKNLSMRPQDVVGAIQTQPMVTSDLVDLRSGSTSVPKLSARENSLSSNYTGKMVGSYAMAASKSMSEQSRQIMSDTYGMLSGTKGINSDEFIRTISGMNNTSVSNFFTYNDLMRVDHTLDQRCHVLTAAPVVKLHNGLEAPVSEHNFSHWGGSDAETVAATILSNSLPSLMVEFGLRHLVIQASNFSGRPMIQIPFALPLVNEMQLSPQNVALLEHRIQQELMDDISMRGAIAYDVFCNIVLTEYSQITVQLDNGPQVMFSAPTFADALCAPVLTAHNEHINEVAFDFNNLMSSLVQVKSVDLDELVGQGFGNI